MRTLIGSNRPHLADDDDVAFVVEFDVVLVVVVVVVVVVLPTRDAEFGDSGT